MTKDEALRLIADRECDGVIAGEVDLGVGACRQRWPGESSEWCSPCLAQQAIEEAEGTTEAVKALKLCGCEARFTER